jgi:hypothetical protein
MERLNIVEGLLDGSLVPCPNWDSKLPSDYERAETPSSQGKSCGMLFRPWPYSLVGNRKAHYNDFACPVCYLNNVLSSSRQDGDYNDLIDNFVAYLTTP